MQHLISMFWRHDSGQRQRDDVSDERDAERVDQDELQQRHVANGNVGRRHPEVQLNKRFTCVTYSRNKKSWACIHNTWFFRN